MALREAKPWISEGDVFNLFVGLFCAAVAIHGIVRMWREGSTTLQLVLIFATSVLSVLNLVLFGLRTGGMLD